MDLVGPKFTVRETNVEQSTNGSRENHSKTYLGSLVSENKQHKPVKLLVVIPSFYPAVIYGGPIFSTYYACKFLADSGTVVKVATTDANGNSRLDVITDKWVDLDGISVKYYSETIAGRLSVPMFWKLWRDIREAEVVHVQAIFSVPTPLALLCCSILGKPCLLSPRGALGDWCLQKRSWFKTGWLRLLVGPLSKRAIWHVTSKQERDDVEAVFPDAKTRIVPNGVHFEKFSGFEASRADFDRKYNIGLGQKAIISMARLEKKKGLDILVRAFALLLEGGKDLRLLIAGPDYGERETLENLAHELGIADRVDLVGALTGHEKLNFLACGDVFVLPSHNENFGNVYVEALASGTPVVASVHTPWSEVEKHGAGLWVNNSPDEVGEAMSKILEAENQQEISLKSRALAREYGWRNIAVRFAQLYSQIVSRGKQNSD